MRAGEVLETVPGVVISQHSGEGKANQYYLRGFNLDHGTDFATTVAGMPVNLPTHGHGHGYSDLNFLIPELISGVQFSKGPYFADQGDFAAAGAANINYTTTLSRPLIRIGYGQDGYGRALAAVAPTVGNGHLLAALEVARDDGPWVRPDDYNRVNGVVRYSQGDTLNGFSLTGMGYRATWNSSDQIPSRAVSSGLLTRFGNIDGTDGGDGSRFSGSLEWQRTRGHSMMHASVYGIASDLHLFSNFTFFLDDPINGDQFLQVDQRFVSGGKFSYRRVGRWGARNVQNTFGAQLRSDDITNVAHYHTRKREIIGTVREDRVWQTSAGVYGQNDVEWQRYLRTSVGVRVDGYRFDVDAGDPANAGRERAALVSPKGGIVIGPWRATEIYANAGVGFHSNDARGTTITRNAITGEPADRVTPLMRAQGAEVGLRTVPFHGFQSTIALWTLALDSELLFVGDAGTTDATRPSRRHGVEWANYFSPQRWLMVDGDIAISRARFVGNDPVGRYVPGAVETVVSAGVTVDHVHNLFGSVRVRYFGPRALTEDNSMRSRRTGLINMDAGYRLSKSMRLELNAFNLLNARDSDIDYFYRSRLPGEPAAGVDDLHFHPTPPRTVRVSMTFGF